MKKKRITNTLAYVIFEIQLLVCLAESAFSY